MKTDLFRLLARSFWPRYLLSSYCWYRKWYSGRWEYHWIELTHSPMWLEMHTDRGWPDWKMPYSRGTPIIEDYPILPQQIDK